MVVGLRSIEEIVVCQASSMDGHDARLTLFFHRLNDLVIVLQFRGKQAFIDFRVIFLIQELVAHDGAIGELQLAGSKSEISCRKCDLYL